MIRPACLEICRQGTASQEHLAGRCRQETGQKCNSQPLPRRLASSQYDRETGRQGDESGGVCRLDQAARPAKRGEAVACSVRPLRVVMAPSWLYRRSASLTETF
jgi:hypothetical protein